MSQPALFVLACGCTGARPAGGIGVHDGRMITAVQIERTGARTAWEAIERLQLRFNIVPTPAGHVLLRSGRGQRSPGMIDQAVVVLDGVRMHASVLHELPADQLVSIEILSGIDATTRYGAGAGHGALLLETRRRHR